MNTPERISEIVKDINLKIDALNSCGKAALFIVTGENGAGKTVFSKKLLCDLAFAQSFNLGVVTKTIRHLHKNQVSSLENFVDEDTDALFTEIIEFSCGEYQKTGVNVLIDGVQIDTETLQKNDDVLGGVILRASAATRTVRGANPTTHFNRKLQIDPQTDDRHYVANDKFIAITNEGTLDDTYEKILQALDNLLKEKLHAIA